MVGTLVGVGVIGTRVAESSGGALAADATLIAPAGPAFAIWTPIYLGLAGFTVFQWRPTQTADPRHRAIGWLAAASMVLNAAWLLVTQQDWIWASVVVMAALVVTLGLLVRRLEENPSYGHGETVLVDGTFGLYLGWVAVAACANVTAALVASGVDPGGFVAELAAVVVIAVAAGSGCCWRAGSAVAGRSRSPWRGACCGSRGDGSPTSRARSWSPSPPSSPRSSCWPRPPASTRSPTTDRRTGLRVSPGHRPRGRAAPAAPSGCRRGRGRRRTGPTRGR